MVVLVAYDVSTVDAPGRRRLARVAQACEDYGTRVQKSLFECLLGDGEWALLRSRLLQEFDAKRDSLRFYYLDGPSAQRTEHFGVAAPTNLAGPLVL